ncbi:drug resistance transporter, EmrB/QacA subfamily [Desulfacinum hydrothermale DSM 13146]|uniref:Drug resistance transporter, EmrB/QacA subfamily n=1 Tax=Desulfacinum hydrothermale DSM 13146 TaxID=1121390 RepID=A0A1W1WYK0_9BACT|nr:MDR family MFS transporter [Desulfacinum hydrothermale]SMC16806.1 drug resistance transporter, EmrB/QacA subfamily [Desulfacinum hydrothermale DSM 13146]
MTTASRLPTSHIWIIASTLTALFLGALDALIVGAAMPTMVAELGGLSLYSWVFSAYLLTRAVALPIFGKLCDLFSPRRLFTLAILIFLAGSLTAGLAGSMAQLIAARAVQGVGAGANFALCYYVISDISAPERRGKMMGLVSFVWGVSSLLGPALGGAIVEFFSWRWIFFINLPLGLAALAGVLLHMQERTRGDRRPDVDYLGAFTLSASILSLLAVFLLAGDTYGWTSLPIVGLGVCTLVFGFAFFHAEKRASEPILPLSSFTSPGFTLGNATAFACSFSVFSLSAFFPLFFQGVLFQSPSRLGLAMIPLSLGWSAGAWFYGQMSQAIAKKSASLAGSWSMAAACAASLFLGPRTPVGLCSAVLLLAGLGMGFVSISTLLIVQDSLDPRDLGVATSSHQFSRTLGGTIGIGATGSLLTHAISRSLQKLEGLPGPENLRNLSALRELLKPEMQERLAEPLRFKLQTVIAGGLQEVFGVCLAAAALSVVLSHVLKKRP